MNLFDNFTSEKNQAELEDMGAQACTYILFFSVDERDEFRALTKKAIDDLIPNAEKDKRNASDAILTLLRKHYG